MSLRARIFSSALLMSGVYGYTELQKSANYTRVDAFLESIEDTCHLEKTRGSVLNRHVTMTESAPCEVVRQLAANHPGYIEYEMIKTTFYTVSYKDSTGQWLMGKLTRLTHQDGRAMNIGEETPILMNKTDNTKIRNI